jgi:hypothetical protein
LQANALSAEGAAPAPAQTKNEKVIEAILQCVSVAQEAVLLPDSVACAPYGHGGGKVPPDTPLNLDFAGVCNDKDDWRALPGNTIKLLAKQPNRIDPQGIRLLGAVFCDSVDLIGLELPYSLVLDRSVFSGGILGRSFRTHGDLSLDKSLVFGELYLARAHIDGTVFASGSFIQKIRVLDAEIHGSLLFRKTHIFELAAFDTILLSGELSVREARLQYLLIQFSKIGGVLDLTGSQARCSYRVRKSEVGDIVAVGSGFGTVKPTPSGLQYDWNPSLNVLDPPDNRGKFTHGSQCDHSMISFSPGSFLISDTKVKSSLCLRSFHWLEGESARYPNSFITFKDVGVGTAASIDLARDDAGSATAKARTHKFEIMGFETGSLFFNFSDTQIQPYVLSLSSLKFEHVFALEKDAKGACDYDPDFVNSDGGKPPDDSGVRQANDPDPGSHSRLPRVEEVMTWLSGNALATTQPFVTFVDVFQKHGEDNDAKALRIAKADAELCLKARHVFGDTLSGWFCSRPASASSSAGEKTAVSQAAGMSASSVVADSSSFFAWGNDFITLGFGGFLRFIADNGYHPEKVGWFVVLAIVVFALYFRFGLGAIGLLPKEKTIILPLGIVFLFDRLLPAYQIREDHYHIESFFRRASKKEIEAGTSTMNMRYLGRNIPVVVTTEVQRLMIERSLDVLKIIGLVLAVFLVAAINALVSR